MANVMIVHYECKKLQSIALLGRAPRRLQLVFWGDFSCCRDIQPHADWEPKLELPHRICGVFDKNLEPI